jgi:hypothetical protein
MRTAIKVAARVLVGSGALLLVLGVIIWTGKADALIGVHIVVGSVLILTLWTIAAIAARSGVPMRTVTLAAAWGVLVVVLGLTQEELVPGAWHWTIQVFHLVISMGAIVWGRRLLRLMGRAHFVGESSSGPRSPVVSSVPQ